MCNEFQIEIAYETGVLSDRLGGDTWKKIL